MNAYDEMVAAAEVVASRISIRPQVALILGSGLGAYADTLENPVRISYSELPGFASSTVKGHAGQFVVGTRHGVAIIAMQGRVHAYEGLPLAKVVLPLRVMWHLGASQLIVTNAAGGINTAFSPGDLMLITDHLNMTGMNPLVGENDERFGPRFPDMSNAYNPAMRELARSAAADLGVSVQEGVYVGNMGPTYETPAEVRMAGRLGGDAVGMSTVPEVIVANHMGMTVLGISCISNMAAGLQDTPLTHTEVQEVTTRVRSTFISLVDRVIERIGHE